MYYRNASISDGDEQTGVDSRRRTVTALVASRKLIGQDGLRIVDWDLEWFEKNPVVLFAHDYHQVPIATGTARMTARGLMGITQFPPAGRYQRSDEIFDAFEDGRMRSFSVGFDVMETLSEQGEGAVRARLREWSCVAIPADPLASVYGPLGRMLPNFTWEQVIKETHARTRLADLTRQLEETLKQISS